jgi:glycosyltransferase involved in cell wall biosynthesis
MAQSRIIRDLVTTFRIDVVHQLIPVSPKVPSRMYKLGAPVIIGPLNGGMEYPPAFQKERGVVSSAGLALGRAIALLCNLMIPGKRFAQLVLVANARTERALPWGVQGRVIELVENGVDLSIWERKLLDESPRSVLRLIFVGRLIDWKALEIVLAAVARASKQVAISLEVIGDGPMRDAWQDLARQMNIDSIVQFSGFLTQSDCAARLQQADIFVLPSLFECGGSVVLEAMAVGLPVIATAWGGPLDYLDESCGILVEPSSREALINGFSEGILKLANSPSLRNAMGQAGHERARRYFDWERKIDQVLQLYAATSRSSVNATLTVISAD